MPVTAPRVQRSMRFTTSCPNSPLVIFSMGHLVYPTVGIHLFSVKWMVFKNCGITKYLSTKFTRLQSQLLHSTPCKNNCTLPLKLHNVRNIKTDICTMRGQVWSKNVILFTKFLGPQQCRKYDVLTQGRNVVSNTRGQNRPWLLEVESRNHVRQTGNTQFLIHIHPFSPLSHHFFYLPLFKSAPKKPFLGRSNAGGTIFMDAIQFYLLLNKRHLFSPTKHRSFKYSFYPYI